MRQRTHFAAVALLLLLLGVSPGDCGRRRPLQEAQLQAVRGSNSSSSSSNSNSSSSSSASVVQPEYGIYLHK